MIYANRTVAGTLLGAYLREHLTPTDPVVIGVPRGGAITASAVAHELHAPLDVVVVERIYAPENPSFPVATVDEEGRLVTMGGNLPLPYHVALEDLTDQVERATSTAQRRAKTYRLHAPHISLADRNVVVVDDGMLTGLTTCAIALYARAHGAATVTAATPVASRQAMAQLAHIADSVVALDTPQPMESVRHHYRHFIPVPDAAVRAVLHHTIEPRLAGRGS